MRRPFPKTTESSTKTGELQVQYSPVLVNDLDKISHLIVRIKESTRGDANPENVNRFVEPAPGTLVEAVSRQHHIVFGRRGSGKSSLLRKAESDLVARRCPVAFVDLDIYKGQTFPNLVASVLRDAFTQYRKLAILLLERRVAKNINSRLNDEIAELDSLIAAPDEAKALKSVIRKRHDKQQHDGGGGLKFFSYFKLSGKIQQGRSDESKHEVELEYAASKQEIVYNHIGFYRETLRLVADTFGNDAFLMLDELYHIPQNLQPLVLDYLHGIARNNRVWLKVGTVRYRSRLLTRTETGSRGIELRQDVQPINLDESFETFAQTQRFLMQILGTFAAEVHLTGVNDLASETAVKRLIQASGGVARDFLTLFVDAVLITKERLARDATRRRRISADDVWDAAAKFNGERRSEFNSDVRLQKPEKLIFTIGSIREFCYVNQLNCILIQDNSSGELRELIDEIWDCKLLHTVKSGLWIGTQQHTAYMLDVSEQASDWHMRRIIIDLDQEDSLLKEQLRQKRLVYEMR
jgi:hypothetical protein